MSAGKTRVGAPITPVITTAGVPGTSDQVRTFQDAGGRPAYARPCVITNMHATADLFVLVNEEGASDVNFLRRIPAQEAVDMSFHGRLNVNLVSLYYASAAYSNVQVRGWQP